MPYTVLVNPVLTPLGDETEEGWEGCLSVPGLRGLVPRFTRLVIPALIRTDSGWSALQKVFMRVECDHLDGLLYPMRIRDMTKFGFNEELFRPATCR